MCFTNIEVHNLELVSCTLSEFRSAFTSVALVAGEFRPCEYMRVLSSLLLPQIYVQWFSAVKELFLLKG